ncbi:hypothetical protein DFH08DRAFT_826678 [Mycena albidolilacea]|uniref:Transmembrane protein n=1 Tax=Mycena albidolilacea TaxID=1033008 RepID=A0AAD6YZI4_9AGAR|nr:hypothetical protein DFH08DRAFT_826678 [Mycena albidolilacea]
MILSAVLFYPTTRVWNLCFLLLWTLIIIVYWVWFPGGIVSSKQALRITVCLIFLHHIIVLVPWKLRGLVLMDLGWTLFEIVDIVRVLSMAQIYTRSISHPGESLGRPEPPRNATIFVTLLNGQESSDLPSDKFHVTTKTGEFNCERIHKASLFECIAGPCGWAETVKIFIPLSIPAAGGLYIAPVQGSILQASAELQQLMIYYAQFTGVLVFPGSQLHGVFTWTRRDLMVTPGISTAVHASSSIHNTTSKLYYQPLTTIFTPDITGLHTTYPANESSLNNATLTLFQQQLEVTRLLQDTVNAIALSDIATFGGFWTFLNGVFALFFGANVLYFMFGQRPLSTLGIVHIFQRHHLALEAQPVGEGSWHWTGPAATLAMAPVNFFVCQK